MRVNVPAAGGKPVRVASFPCYTFILFQIIGPDTVRVGSTEVELQGNQDQGIQDGVQLNQATTTPPYGSWWKGDLWVMSNGNAFAMIVETPGAGNALSQAGIAS